MNFFLMERTKHVCRKLKAYWQPIAIQIRVPQVQKVVFSLGTVRCKKLDNNATWKRASKLPNTSESPVTIFMGSVVLLRGGTIIMFRWYYHAVSCHRTDEFVFKFQARHTQRSKNLTPEHVASRQSSCKRCDLFWG